MCGIVGIFETRSQNTIDRDLLARMNDSQRHRGPDEEGLHMAPGLGLGHRRLAIIDLAEGQQPLFNADRSVVVVYNGEIYNFKELTEELKSAGYRFKTHSDTEVIVHAWAEWGEACVERFRGMFVFALWDSKKETLFLARDRIGIKPLYYSLLASGTLIFGSELKSLILHPELSRELDPLAVEEYFGYGYVPDPRTIYRGVHKLAPGHVLIQRRNDLPASPRQYWDVRFDEVENLSEDEICESLIEELREAVKIRMIAEVPLGAFLSGGVDSSAVVALMAGLSDKPVDTCSIGFGAPEYDESKYAGQVSKQFGTNHHVNQVDPDSFDLVDSLMGFYDEPFADSSAMPTYQVCKLAREKVTVALSGDGGDELFAGYRRYRWHHYEEQVRSRVPAGLRGPVFSFLGRFYPKLDWAPKPLRAKTTFQALARGTVGGYFDSVSVLNDELRNGIYSDNMRRELQGYHASEVVGRFMREAPTDHYLSRVQYADLKTYLPGDILTKVDRASMANSLEVRVPILDHKFIEWSARIAPHHKLKGREGKHIFKKALEPYLSNDILYRDKMGFAVPLAQWFRGPLRERVREALTSETLGDTGLFDMAFIESLVDQHQSGVREHSAAIWSLVMFESFLRKVHTSGESPVSLPPREPARVPA